MQDLIGKKIGKLEVLEYKGIDKRGRGTWLCQCDCGKNTLVCTGNLNIGKTKSCGCLKKMKSSSKDLIGKKYHNLTLTKIVGKSTNFDVIYECVCDCGRKGKIRRSKIGKTKSCHQCYYLRINNGYKDIYGWYISSIKHGAKLRGLDYLITPEYMWEVFEKQNRMCFYTGRKLNFTDLKNRTKQTASLDRLDNSKGYIKGNICWTHREINMFKMGNNHKEFINLCEEIVEWKNQHTKQ